MQWSSWKSWTRGQADSSSPVGYSANGAPQAVQGTTGTEGHLNLPEAKAPVTGHSCSSRSVPKAEIAEGAG